MLVRGLELRPSALSPPAPSCDPSFDLWLLSACCKSGLSARCNLPHKRLGVIDKTSLTPVRRRTTKGPVKQKLIGWVVAGGAFMALVGCSRKYLTVAETDVVVTVVDKGRDYSDYRTYLMPDSIVDLCEDDENEEDAGPLGGAGGRSGFTNCVDADHSLDDEILNALRRNMDDLGYREITDPDNETPDVAFLAGIVARDNWFVSSGSSYCYPYYYYYGCYYPGYTYTYNLPTNTVLIDMVDVAESEDGELSQAWAAIIKGLDASSSEKSGPQRVNEAMDQAFKQSPYLADGGDN